MLLCFQSRGCVCVCVWDRALRSVLLVFFTALMFPWRRSQGFIPCRLWHDRSSRSLSLALFDFMRAPFVVADKLYYKSVMRRSCCISGLHNQNMTEDFCVLLRGSLCETIKEKHTFLYHRCAVFVSENIFTKSSIVCPHNSSSIFIGPPWDVGGNGLRSSPGSDSQCELPLSVSCSGFSNNPSQRLMSFCVSSSTHSVIE